jgi:hypothetical protein
MQRYQNFLENARCLCKCFPDDKERKEHYRNEIERFTRLLEVLRYMERTELDAEAEVAR